MFDPSFCSKKRGELCCSPVWIVHKVVHGEPTKITVLVSAPFAIVMFGAMLRRLNDLKWPTLLLISACMTYLWILGDNVFFRSGWPIVIPGFVVSILGIYSGVLWLLISYVSGKPGTGEQFADRL